MEQTKRGPRRARGSVSRNRVVYGRNVVQHPDPGSLIAALSAIVHQQSSVDEALALVNEPHKG